MAHNNSSICSEYFSWEVDFGAFSIIINGVVTVLTVILGSFGNIYNIHTVKKLRISKALALYLVILLIWDTGVLLCSMGYYGIHAFIKLFHMRFKYLPYFTQILNGPCSTTMIGSIWMVIVITISRYSAISNPLRHRAAETKRRAQTISAIAIIFACIYSLPHYFEFTVMPCIHEKISQPWYSVMPTSLRLSPSYHLIYKVILNLIFVSFVPFMVILVLSIRMMVLVHRSLHSELFEGRAPPLLPNRKLSTPTRQQQSERKTSIMLISLLAKFLICYSLSIVLNLVEAIKGDVVTNSSYFILIMDISNWLVVLNSATNCIIYFWSGHKARRLQKHEPGTVLSMRMSTEAITFTQAEILTLQRGWRQAVERRGTKLSTNILSQMVPCDGCITISLEEHSQKMHKFMDDLLSSLSNLPAAQTRCRLVAIAHIDMGMSVELWNKFKLLMLSEVLALDSNQFRQLIGSHGGPEAREAQIWDRFLGFVMAEMRKYCAVDIQIGAIRRAQSTVAARQLAVQRRIASSSTLV